MTTISTNPVARLAALCPICQAAPGQACCANAAGEKYVHVERAALPAPEPPRLNDMSVEDILDYYGVPPGGDPWHRINELGQMYRRALQKSGASALELLRRVVEVDHGADGLHGTIAAAKELLARAAPDNPGESRHDDNNFD